MPHDGRIRVLRVFSSMAMGGIQTTAMHLFRRMDSSRFSTDFVCLTPQSPSPYDQEIAASGARLMYCPKRNILRFRRDFRRLLNECGPYDVVHSHLELFNGVIMKMAHDAGAPVRIAHSHHDFTECLTRRSRLLVWLNRYLMRSHATSLLAISRRAGDTYYGQPLGARAIIIPQGRDFSGLAEAPDPDAVRDELGIPRDAFIIGNVARFNMLKNHGFLLKVAAEAVRMNPRAHALLVGDGELRGEIEAQVEAMGLKGRVTLAGLRHDVPRLTQAMDAFVFPSLREGLGMALVEAQAAGLPCVFSDVIPADVDIVPDLVRRRSLNDTPLEWAQAALAPRSGPTPRECLRIAMESHFSIDHLARTLERLYTQSSVGALA